MPKTTLPYAAELKRRLVEMVRAGRTSGEFAIKFEPSVHSHPDGASRPG